MKLEKNVILITGGSNGIGLALAERFLKNNNEVIICGRREEKLAAAKEKFPGLHIKCCDVGNEQERIDLRNWTLKNFPGLNILVNNAGIQNTLNLKDEGFDWKAFSQEIEINLAAPIHLSKLFLPHLMEQESPAVINVSSGLAFMPPVWAPVYGATKAGLHSFTFSMRQQLSDTSVEVTEIIPPAVNTDLGGPGKHTFGIDVNEFADAVWNGFKEGKNEIAYGDHLERTKLSREETEKSALEIWKNFR